MGIPCLSSLGRHDQTWVTPGQRGHGKSYRRKTARRVALHGEMVTSLHTVDPQEDKARPLNVNVLGTVHKCEGTVEEGGPGPQGGERWVFATPIRPSVGV